MLVKIISGGQTGVDRAGLDAALAQGIPIGGSVPRGRLAEDGPVPLRYPMIELDSPKYPVRTRANVLDSDGTLILCSLAQYQRSRGTKLTVTMLRQYEKPFWVADPTKESHLYRVIGWLKDHEIKVFNIAGPRESTCSGIYEASVVFLEKLFQLFR